MWDLTMRPMPGGGSVPIDRLLRRPVKTLPPEATCQEAAALMRDENVGAVVVSEDRRPLGVVTDRDLVVRVVAPGEDAPRALVRDVMTDRKSVV